ncbi:hypothetical protein HDU92_000643 [Lobulomyces angularis]|nr:hypothetical protein HDU92_000643 [Lobulomyces angularis]
MGCCGEADWKREQIADHKFDYINVDDFITDSVFSYIKYFWLFLITLKSILVYMADVGIVIIYVSSYKTLISDSGCDITESGGDSFMNNPALCFNKGVVSTHLDYLPRVLIVLGSVLISFVLLIIDWVKAKRIIKSKDISYSLTSNVTYRYYSIQSYAYFCFFQKIQNSRRTMDILAFYVFFTFKSWKKLFLAELPRQFLYGLFFTENLIQTYQDQKGLKANKDVASFDLFLHSVKVYFQNIAASPTILAQQCLMLFTVLIWIFSFISFICAIFIYFPLLAKIQGNLKEYCCHKIDKRIDGILRKQSKKRVEEATRHEMEEIGNMKSAAIKYNPDAYSDSDVTSDYCSSNKGSKRVPPPLGLSVGPTIPEMREEDFSPHHYSSGPQYNHVQYSQQQHPHYNIQGYQAQYHPNPNYSQQSQYSASTYNPYQNDARYNFDNGSLLSTPSRNYKVNQQQGYGGNNQIR